MTLAPQTTAPPTDSELIAALISSHGDLDLAAERAHIDKALLVARFPYFNKEELNAGIRSALAIQALESLTTVKTVLLASLADLSPSQQSRLLLDLFKQAGELVAPPPAPVQSAGSTNLHLSLQNLMANEAENARDALAQRFVAIDEPTGAPELPQQPQPGTTTDTTVRLGVERSA